jgi:hypothetical protein
MTVGEYISAKFKAWNISDAQMLDVMVDSGLNADDEMTSEVKDDVQKAMIPLVEELMLLPILKTVSENGFSVTWDFSNMGRYYLWLCRKYGVTPNSDVEAAMGLSSITDKSDIW